MIIPARTGIEANADLCGLLLKILPETNDPIPLDKRIENSITVRAIIGVPSKNRNF